MTITREDFAVLERIAADPHVSISSLARDMGVRIARIDWHVDRLVADGLVEVNRRAQSESRPSLTVTPAGQALLADGLLQKH